MRKAPTSTSCLKGLCTLRFCAAGTGADVQLTAFAPSILVLESWVMGQFRPARSCDHALVTHAVTAAGHILLGEPLDARENTSPGCGDAASPAKCLPVLGNLPGSELLRDRIGLVGDLQAEQQRSGRPLRPCGPVPGHQTIGERARSRRPNLLDMRAHVLGRLLVL